MFAGQPLGEITKQQPSFWFRDESSGNVQQGVDTSYNSTTSTFRFRNLPCSVVGISVAFHATGDKPTLPGNFDLWHTVDLNSDCSRKDYDLQMEKIIRLLAPVDSAAVLHEAAPEYPTYFSPVPVKWEGLTGASIYQITVKECRDQGNPAYVSGCDRCTTVGLIQSMYPFASLALPPSADLTHFEISLVAADASQRSIGKLMTTYDNGAYGWDYRFRAIKPDSSPNRPVER
jgi:hypothetical protein